MIKRLQHKSTLFPYTTLFRSLATGVGGPPDHRGRALMGIVVVGAAVGGWASVVLGGARSELVITGRPDRALVRSEEHTSELQSRLHLVCRLLLEKKNLMQVVL